MEREIVAVCVAFRALDRLGDPAGVLVLDQNIMWSGRDVNSERAGRQFIEQRLSSALDLENINAPATAWNHLPSRPYESLLDLQIVDS